jgi:reactive intermediate/imine deaminase
MKQMIETTTAPKPGGTYSQAIRSHNTVYLSGQIAVSPETNQMIEGNFVAEARQVFRNLSCVAKAADGDLNKIVKLTIFLTDLADFPVVNQIMTEIFELPYPARSTFQVAALPAGARIEVEAVMEVI